MAYAALQAHHGAHESLPIQVHARREEREGVGNELGVKVLRRDALGWWLGGKLTREEALDVDCYV